MLTENQAKFIINALSKEYYVSTDDGTPEGVRDIINSYISVSAKKQISNICLSDGQAQWLKKQIKADNPDIIHEESTLISAIFKTIDDSVQTAAEEPRQFHLKNIIAFIVLMRNSKFPDLAPTSIAQKFERFCLSHKPDEYKWGIYPGLYGQLYHYFDMWNIELDSGELRAKEFAKIGLGINVDRRWVDDAPKEMPDFAEVGEEQE